MSITRLNAALEGRYRIESELGEGGMATVYLADDIKHERKVALKVLKPELAAVVGAERFLAEIKTTANLSHPHILPLHDSGEADSYVFYVMPHVEGESLRSRIDREKQLPVDEAVRIATAVANALQHAHERGVIHRDIKPANVLIQDGEPLIADFGIALAVGSAGGTRLTETGLSVGTPYYMSPEQATGDQEVGPATDTYAVAAVLYEILTGDPPYLGSTAQAVLGKIIQGAPVSAYAIRKSIPANVDAAIRKALEKLPADRFTSVQEFAKALGDEHFRYGELATVGEGAAVGPWNRLTIATTTLAAVTTLALAWSFLRPEPPAPVARFASPFEEGQSPTAGGSSGMDFTADGSALVYAGPGASGEGTQLWIRRWANLDADPIRGTEGAILPALSPDEREVAFTAQGVLRVAPLDGGPSRTLAEGGGGVWDWSSDGWVYFTQTGSLVLARVPATGGGSEAVETLIERREGEIAHTFFSLLPGEQMGVFQVLRDLRAEASEVWAIDLETRERSFLTAGNTPLLASTGHLLFATADGVLMAQRIDPATAELAGPAVPVAEGLAIVIGFASYAMSEGGTLIYVVGGAVGGSNTPVWVERDGTSREIDPGWATRGMGNSPSVSLSPTGDRLAISMLDSEGATDLWVKQLDTGPLSRLTFDGPQNIRATWSPDGRSLTFSSARRSVWDVWTKRADGSGTAELVLDREHAIGEALYSPDRTWLIFREGATALGEGDIYAIQPGVDSAAVVLTATEFNEYAPALSPDGRWLAYNSNESGREEVYVMPFPEGRLGGGLVQVSASGGRSPVWAHSGRELFYRNGADEMVAVQVSGDPTFAAGQQEILFSTGDYFSNNGHAMYDVSPDDQRFVMLRRFETQGGSEVILVQNFFEELRQRVPN